MSSSESNLFTAKILLIGESAVGKSSLLLQFTENKFKDCTMGTIGVDYKTKVIDIDGTSLKLQIFDTAGQEKFRTITKTYYRGAKGILVVFDVSRKDTFVLTRFWIDSIKESATSDVDVALVGNKCDLPRAVTKEEASKYADEYKIPYFETSAKDGTNVSEIFAYLGKTILKRETKNPETREEGVTKIEPKKEQKKEGCGC
ncbi:hypothetical protein M9Y10_015421 [Tritrichomonas musculus]|uniref:Uncharacterized protein n=1 Tax=Tritrichomonas musculus TaxID=1915356 RepID=A0ABR2L2D1_9EUKA